MPKKDGASEVLATIAAMTDGDRAVAQRLHEVITSAAPEPGHDPRPRAALDAVQLDDGNVWPTSYAVTKVTDADATKISALVKKAVG